MLYDGESGFCTRARDFFNKFEFGDSIVWTPYQAGRELPGIPEEALQKRIHLVVDARSCSGFTAFQKLLLYNPTTYLAMSMLLSICELFAVQRWLVFPLLLLFSPLAVPMGDIVTDRVAQNRRRLLGCSLASTFP